MLEFIRKYRGFFLFVFGIAVIALVVSMMGTSGTGLGGAGGGRLLPNTEVAKVGQRKITLREFQTQLNFSRERAEEYLEEQMKSLPGGQQSNREFFARLIRSQISPQNILNNLVERAHNIDTAEELGIKVPAAIVREKIFAEPGFQTDGRFDVVKYKERLRIPPNKYEQLLADQEISSLMDQYLNDSVGIVSPLEQKNSTRLNVERSYAALRVNPKNFKSKTIVNDKKIQAFLALPESNQKLNDYYQDNIEQYSSPEELHAKHILIKDDKKLIDELLKDIRSKKISFEDAAKKHSIDKSNASKGGDLGFFKKGVMDPAFEKAAFSLAKDGDVTVAPVKSSFGWHLIKRVAYKAANKKDFASIKNKIAKEVITAENKKREIAQVFSEARQGKSKILSSYGLKWEKLKKWNLSDRYLEGVGSLDDQELQKVLALNSKKPYLESKLNKGDNWILLHFLEQSKASPKAEVTAESLVSQGREKATDFLNFFMKSRKAKLEKDKKIVISSKVMSLFNENPAE